MNESLMQKSHWGGKGPSCILFQLDVPVIHVAYALSTVYWLLTIAIDLAGGAGLFGRSRAALDLRYHSVAYEVNLQASGGLLQPTTPLRVQASFLWVLVSKVHVNLPV